MKTIIATFPTASAADKAVGSLEASGVAKDQISVMTLDSTAQGQLPASMAVSKASDDAATGALQGAKLGLVGGLLVGVAALTIPGLGPLLAVGPLASALGVSGVVGTAVTGAGLGTAIGGIGAMVGSLTKMGVTEAEAEAFDKDLRSGAVLVSVKEQPNLDVLAAINSAQPTRIAVV